MKRMLIRTSLLSAFVLIAGVGVESAAPITTANPEVPPHHAAGDRSGRHRSTAAGQPRIRLRHFTR